MTKEIKIPCSIGMYPSIKDGLTKTYGSVQKAFDLMCQAHGYDADKTNEKLERMDEVVKYMQEEK